MGREQQITLLCAEIAHNTRCKITAFLEGSCDIPEYDKLDEERKGRVVSHTSLVLAGRRSATDCADEAALAVAAEIRRIDEAQSEPQFEAPPSVPAEVFEARDKMITEAEQPVFNVRLMDDEGKMQPVDMKEETK